MKRREHGEFELQSVSRRYRGRHEMRPVIFRELNGEGLSVEVSSELRAEH